MVMELSVIGTKWMEGLRLGSEPRCVWEKGLRLTWKSTPLPS